MKKYEIENDTRKIMIRGDRDNALIKAIQDLPKEQQEELYKVINVTLFDGYPLSVFEWID